jgi:hypothetical protein
MPDCSPLLNGCSRLTASTVTSNAYFRMADDHEHVWTYHPPATVGAKGVECCDGPNGCGLYRDPDPERGIVIPAPTSTLWVP